MKSKLQRYSTKKSLIGVNKFEIDSDIISKKARNLAHNLRWGKGSTDRMKKILLDALGKPCYWCDKELNIDSIQLDHKNPIKRPTEYSKHKFILLNSPKNLRIICKSCNLIKGTIPEKKFQKLMNFLNTDRQLKYIIKSALLFYNYRYPSF